MVISIPDLEQRAALGWRAQEEERLGAWLLRAAGGFTGRANSALAVGDPGRPLDQAAGAVRDWYQARGLTAMIAIPYPAGRPRAARALYGHIVFAAHHGYHYRVAPALQSRDPAPGTADRAAGPGRPADDVHHQRCPLADVGTLVFDVLGTVVDEAGSVAAETARALAAAGAGPPGPGQVAAEWTRQVEALTGQIAAGEAPWRSNDALRRDALREALRSAAQHGLSSALASDQALLDDLALIGHWLRPWPDSPRGAERPGQALHRGRPV